MNGKIYALIAENNVAVCRFRDRESAEKHLKFIEERYDWLKCIIAEFNSYDEFRINVNIP